MEQIRFTICEQCRGTGYVQRRKCGACFGLSRFYFDNNNFLYWDKKINHTSIFVREARLIRDIVINAILIIGAILSIVVIYKILNIVQFDPRNLWTFVTSSHDENFWLAILAAGDMLLYYRLALPGIKKNINLQKLRDSNTFTKYNIAESLSQETESILDKAWLYASYKRIWPVTVWHLFYILLNDKDIRLVLARLGVGSQNLQQIIDKNLQTMVAKNLTKPMAEKTELTEELKDVLLTAYYHAISRKVRRMEEIDFLAGLVHISHDIKDFFYEFDIDDNKIDNVITWININLILRNQAQFYRARSIFKPKGDVNRSYTAIATPALDAFSQDLTKLARGGRLPLSVAREKEINELLRVVESDFTSVILIGPNGVGKENIIDGLANQMMAEDVPELFQDKRLVSLSIPLLISGAGGMGRLEERFMTIINEISVSGNIILFIENIHHLAGVGSEGSEAIDLSHVLASEIRKKNLVVIGTTTPQDFIASLEGKELGEVLQQIKVEEPDKNQSIKIMEAHVGWLENKHQIYFTYNALEKIYDLTDRYLPDQYLPSKALNIMEEVALMIGKTKRQDRLIRAEDVAQLISEKTNIPLTQVSEQESSKLMNLEEEIHQRIIGQDEAVKKVASALRRARAELRDQKRPIANFLFMGPTGVGKTELAKTVAATYFGKEENMIRLDMSEYQTQANLDRLIGSTQAGKPGLLTEAVRHQPFALLLLDEIEKAHPDILNIFLQVMDDGRLTDALGRTVDFTNLIIVATSNAGTQFIQDRIRENIHIEDITNELINNQLKEIFRPEFLNRFDSVVVFRPLTPEEIFLIAGLLLNKVKQRLETKGIFLEVTKAAQQELAEVGFDPVFGARPLRRVIQDRVDDALARFLLQGNLGRRDVVVYDVGGKISVKKAESYK